MPYRQLITIPMPTGVTNNTLHLSVALVPRLQEDGALADYDLDWAQWPNIANALDYTIQLNNAPPIDPARITVLSDPARLDVWEAVFGAATDSKQPVEKYSFIDRRASVLRDFPSAAVVDGLRDLYTEVSDTYPENPPTRKQVLRLTAAALLRGSTLVETEDYLALISDPPVVPVEGPGVEFHQLMTALRAHPLALRLLGLVVDLDIELQVGLPLPRLVRVGTSWATITGTAVRDECALAMRLDADGWPEPMYTDEHDETYLRLADPTRYSMTTSDLVSASQRLLDYQRTVINRDGDEPAPIPAPREAGVAAVHTDLANILGRRFSRHRELENQIDQWLTSSSNQVPRVFLEDVTAGYRYDVLDEDDPTWRSVFERRTADGYEFPRKKAIGVEVPDDEGRWILAMSTEMSETIAPKSTTVRYEQEGKPDIIKEEGTDGTTWRLPIDAFRWTGWSAATPHPGSSLNGSGEAIEPASNIPAGGQEAQLVVDYQPVPGTLPRLRYGRTYQLRARATDFAGNSKTVADPEPDAAVSAPIVFGRTQPVEAPLSIRTAPKPVPGVGDTPSTLVIKSELGQPDGDIAATSRLLFPPRFSQARLELHGLPDGGIDPASYAFLAERDALRLDDQAGVDPLTGELVAGTIDADGNHTPAQDQPVAAYLVDPAALAVTLANAPGQPVALPIDYRGAWPEQQALGIELASGPDSTVAPADGVIEPIRFSVPRGRVRTVELSHGVTPDLVDHFDAFRTLAPTRQSELRSLVEDGRHHIVSARTSLQLVHAVRVPVEPATFSGTDPAIDRDAGSRLGRITDDITIDRPSTRQIVLIGAWTDPVDDVSLEAPIEHSFTADVAVPIDLSGPEMSGALDRTTLDLVDPRRHTVTMEMEAFSRFSRFFTEQVEDFSIPSNAGGRNLDVTEGVVARSVDVITPDGRSLERNVDFTVDAEVGTIFRVEGAGMEPDVAHTVRYIPRPISRSSVEAPLGVTTQVFPAAIRPTAPVVDDVVPAARRSIVEGPNRTVIEHDGRVLRVMLRRPWWSSGEDERLAVTLDQNPVGVPSRTRWGRDPLIQGGDTLAIPGIEHFPASSEQATAVDGGDVDVAAHAVTFDAERNLWLADVEIDGEVGERPFVQLGLARYQPIALDGLAMSEEVQTEPVRLGPRRRVVVARTATVDTLRCVVDHAPDDHAVQVRVQVADPAITDTDLRWSDAIDAVTREAMIIALDPLPGGASTRHRGRVTLPTTASDLRLVIEDRQPVTRTDAEFGDLVDHEVVYRETVEIPATWRG